MKLFDLVQDRCVLLVVATFELNAAEIEDKIPQASLMS
jgi:hypothetical protein